MLIFWSPTGSSGTAPSCDYPVPSTVLHDTVYAYGALVGTYGAAQTLRDLLDKILNFVGETSLTDVEYDDIGITEESTVTETYLALLAVLNTRGAISATVDRLAYYFRAKGFEVSQPAPEPEEPESKVLIGDELDKTFTVEPGKSNIFIGGEL